ncbi:MAG: heparinase II/III domain-containing protein [Roseateles sp.]
MASTERLVVSDLRSGDGVKTSASTVVQLAQPDRGAFYGFREAREEWTRVKTEYKSRAEVRDWIAYQKNKVDAWITRGFEKPDYIGGWIHDYVDPKTGGGMSWTPTSAEPAAGTTVAEIAFKAAWVAYGRGYNVQQMRTAARIYKATGEAKYADWAAQQLDFYADNYAKWPLQTKDGRSRMYKQGLDEAVDAFSLLDVVRLLDGYVAATRATRWKTALFMPMADNLRYSMAEMTNIALWHEAARAAIALRYKDSTLLEAALIGPKAVRAILRYGVTVDNVWVEGTFEYNNYVLAVLAKLLTQASLEGRSDEFTVERDASLKLALGMLDYRFDNWTLPNPADSVKTQKPISEAVHGELYRVLPTYWGLAEAGKTRTWESLIDPPEAVPAKAPTLPPVTSRHFTAMRQAVLRSGDWQAFVHYGQVNGFHSQEELTNFELFHGSTPIAVDPGTVSYSSPLHKGYFATGVGNNVPLIDGLGQTKWAPGDVLAFDPARAFLSVQQSAYQPGVSVTRTYRVTNTGFAEQSTIFTNAVTDRRLGVVFNTDCSVDPSAGLTESTAAQALPGSVGFKQWAAVKRYTTGSDGLWSLTLSCGSKTYVMRVKGPARQLVHIGTAPTVPVPKRRQSVYYEAWGKTASFEAQIQEQPAVK